MNVSRGWAALRAPGADYALPAFFLVYVTVYSAVEMEPRNLGQPTMLMLTSLIPWDAVDASLKPNTLNFQLSMRRKHTTARHFGRGRRRCTWPQRLPVFFQQLSYCEQDMPGWLTAFNMSRFQRCCMFYTWWQITHLCLIFPVFFFLFSCIIFILNKNSRVVLCFIL